MKKKFELGMKALDVCKVIIENNQIEEVTLVAYNTNFSNLRNKYCNLKDYTPDKTKTFQRTTFLNFTYESMPDINDEEVLGISSKVKYHSSHKHIPMIDFILVSKRYKNKLKNEIINAMDNIASFIGYTGVWILLDSGNSFHCYGDSLLNENEWKRFVKKFSGWIEPPIYIDETLDHFVIDREYMRYSLEKGYNTLRLTANKNKPKIPEVIEIL